MCHWLLNLDVTEKHKKKKSLEKFADWTSSISDSSLCILASFLSSACCSVFSAVINQKLRIICQTLYFLIDLQLVTRPVSTHPAISTALGSKWEHADWIMLIYELHREKWMTRMATQMDEISAKWSFRDFYMLGSSTTFNNFCRSFCLVKIFVTTFHCSKAI